MRMAIPSLRGRVDTGSFRSINRWSARSSPIIADQRVHHRKVTFQEEYMAFLKKHEMEFDERYMWD